MPPSPSYRRPSDFLGSNLETTDMDPDLMFSSASMGGYLQLPDWNASSTAVHEYEIATPDEDEPEAGRLMLRRTFARVGARLSVPLWDSWAGESTVAVCGSCVMGEFSSSRGQGLGLGKRRFSARVGEGFAGFGRAVKRRTSSWSWRRDSVMPPRQGRALRGRVDGSSSSIASPSSGERSRDGDDELSGGDELVRRGRQSRPWIRGLRRKSTQTGPVSGRVVVPSQRRQTLPVPPKKLLTYNKNYLKRLEEQEFRDASPERRFVLIERGLRIAEAQGAFDTAVIEKAYKKPHQRLNSECRQQSQASIKLKVKLAKKAAKSDKKFRQRQESRDNESPISKVFNKLWRRNSRGQEAMVESDPASGLRSSGNDASSDASQSAWSEDTIDRQRTMSIEAVVHIGRAVGLAAQQAPVPF